MHGLGVPNLDEAVAGATPRTNGTKRHATAARPSTPVTYTRQQSLHRGRTSEISRNAALTLSVMWL